MIPPTSVPECLLASPLPISAPRLYKLGNRPIYLRALLKPARSEVSNESAFFTQIRQVPSSRLQDRASPRQGFRDLQEQSAIQGASALSDSQQIHVDKAAQAALCVSRPSKPATCLFVRNAMELRLRIC